MVEMEAMITSTKYSFLRFYFVHINALRRNLSQLVVVIFATRRCINANFVPNNEKNPNFKLYLKDEIYKK